MYSRDALEASPVSGARGGSPDLRVRLRGVVVAAACWALLLLGTSLRPRPSGLGTHEQLGLPGCSFLARTGFPCPSCGLTTSFSAAAQGRWGAALKAQPFGVAIYLAVLVLGAAGMGELICGDGILETIPVRFWWIWVGLAGMLAGWGWRLASGLLSGELPLR